MDGLYSMAIPLNNIATNLRRPVALDIYDSFMGPGDKFCGGSEYNLAALQHLQSSFHSFPFLLNNSTLMPSTCVSSYPLHSPAPHFLIPDLVSSQIWQVNLPHIPAGSSGDDDFIRPPLLIDGLIGTSGSPGITSRGEALGLVIPHDLPQDSPTSSMGMSSNKRTKFSCVEKCSFSTTDPCKIPDNCCSSLNCMKKEEQEEHNYNFEGIPCLEDICLAGVPSNNIGHLPCKSLHYNENNLNSMTEQLEATNVSIVERICSSSASCKTVDFQANVSNSVKEEERKQKVNYDFGGFSCLENVGLGDESLSTLLWESYIKNMQQPLDGPESAPESSTRYAFSRELEEFDDFLESLKRMQESQSNHDDPASLTRGRLSTPSRTLGHVSFWDPSAGERDAFGSTVTTQCKERIGSLPAMVSMPALHQERHAKIQKVDHDKETTSLQSTTMLLQQPPWGMVLHPMRSNEQARVSKKRSRSGENPRPRPKDRQQIQDCVLELRNIIPSSKKCSIDALLEKTIKYINFLQTVTVKWNETIKLQADKGNGPNTTGSAGGASWAVELGEDGNKCPIIVENLSQPGQLLVEILCEKEDITLEIPESIRRLGLTILKGVMEMRNNKLWANFVVEADREVHRVEVLWSLMQLFESSDTKASSNVTNSR